MEKKSYKDLLQRRQGIAIEDVSSFYEYSVVIASLEAYMNKKNKNDSIMLAATEIGIHKNVAIIRHPYFSLDLINPKIASETGKYIRFGDYCKRTKEFYNTMRSNTILLENTLSRGIDKYNGDAAYLVQKSIDLIHNIYPEQRKIKLAKVRHNGVIYNMDFCPCGSKERFYRCCKKNP